MLLGGCAIPLAAAGAFMFLLPSAGRVGVLTGLHTASLVIAAVLYPGIIRAAVAAHGTILHPTCAHCTASHPAAHAHSARSHTTLCSSMQSEERNQ